MAIPNANDPLVWYHSVRKAERDVLSRHHRIERASGRLAELRQKLASPRTRYSLAIPVFPTMSLVETDIKG
jgi:hypothetical protein